jgi:hypothetical protein
VLIRTGVAAVAMLVACVATSGVSASAASGCKPTSGTFDGASWIACASDANAKTTIPIAHDRTNPTVANEPANRGTPNPSYQVQLKCTYSNTDALDGTAPPAPRAGAGRWMFTYCGDSGQPGGWAWVPSAGAVVFASPAQLARQAYARLTPPAAAPDYNPRHRAGSSDGTVVGFMTWLWLDGQSLTAKTATATAGPNRATVTARPSVVSFDPGDGSPSVVCAGGGRAYDPAAPNAVSECVHRYLRSSGAAPGGVFVLTARVTWTATWAGSGGTGGVLPALTVAAATPVRVDELQAVNE